MANKVAAKVGREVKEDAAEMVRLGQDVIAVSKSLVKGAIELVFGRIVILLIVLALCYVLIWMRHGFFAVTPGIIKHSKRWDRVLVAVGDTFVAMVDAVIVIVDAITGVASLFSRHKRPDTSAMHHFKRFPHFSSADLRAALLNVTTTCANVTSPGELVTLGMKLAVGDNLCPYLRASYPLGVAGDLFRNATGWASPPSDPLRGNCNWPEGAPGIWCIYLASGLLAFDILVPLLLLTIVVGPQGILRIGEMLVHALKLGVMLTVGPLVVGIMLAVGEAEELQDIVTRVTRRHSRPKA